MASDTWIPNFVVGIDFGMTCTGVGYSSAPEWADPKVLQYWPGRYQDENFAEKVPTQVGYDEQARRKNWGFECNVDDETSDIKDWFKLYLNPGFNDNYPERPTREQAVQYYQDFMRYLREHIENRFHVELGARWVSKKVEYLFSIPTTWKDPTLTAELRSWLEAAGFVKDSPTRRFKITQTEAEAAAVHAAKQSDPNDVVMVCDAGGGTTDINVLKVKSRTRDGTQLTALNKAEGINAGSAWIDQRVERLVRDQIRAITGNNTPTALGEAARRIMNGQFEPFKRAFGGPGTLIDSLRMSEPRSRGTSRSSIVIDQPVVISTDQLRVLFDEQLRVIFEKMDDQMQELQDHHPNERIKYMVLSGGLGRSQYVQDQVRARYVTAPARYHNAREISLLCPTEPQLVVVKGLVMDRIQRLNRGVGVYTGMCCRVSYGVLCRYPYNQIKHRGEKVSEDPLDGKKWAEDQIDWLIKEGQPVSPSGVRRPYQLKIPVGKEDETWYAHFYMSERPANDLPKSLRYGNVRKICTVYSKFDRADFQLEKEGHSGSSKNPFKLKGNSLFTSRKQHYVARFDVNVIMGSTDLRFQLLSKDGRSYSTGEHDHIHVDWEEARATPAASENMGAMFPE